MELYMLIMLVSGAPATAAAKSAWVTRKAVW